MLKRNRSILCRLLPAIVLGVMPLSGCYERVVGVKGPGASTYKIYEPNLKEDTNEEFRIPFLDDLGKMIFGPREDSQRRR